MLHIPDMEILVYLICIALASFAVLAQPAVAQGANTNFPLIYSGQILQGDGSQTCHSEGQRERVRNEVDNATQRLLQESVVPLLQANSTEHVIKHLIIEFYRKKKFVLTRQEAEWVTG